MKNLISFVVFLWSLINASTATASLDLEAMMDEATNGTESSLYLPKPSMVRGVETVTYYVSAETPDRLMMDSFFEFARIIGKQNGAVYLPMQAKSRANSLAFIKESTCDASYFASTSVVYEDRGKKQCFSFMITNRSWLISTFAAIIKQLENKGGMKAKTLEFNLKQVIEQNMKRYGIPDDNKIVFHALVDYMIGVLY